MPVGKHYKRNCYKKLPILSQVNSHVLQGGGEGMYCKLVGGGTNLFRETLKAGKGKPHPKINVHPLAMKLQAQGKSLQGGGEGMYCGVPTVLPPKLVGGGNGMYCGGPNVPNPMAKPATKSRDEFFKNFGMNR